MAVRAARSACCCAGVSRASSVPPPEIDYGAIAERAGLAAAESPSSTHRVGWGPLRLAAVAAMTVVVVGLSVLIGGETGQAQQIASAVAEATGELVDSLFNSSALNGIEFAVADLGAPADPLRPVMDVNELF